MNINRPGYDPGKRQRCVGVAWTIDRHVRILRPEFGLKGKIGSITSVGERLVYVRVVLGRKPAQWVEVAYLPEHLKLI